MSCLRFVVYCGIVSVRRSMPVPCKQNGLSPHVACTPSQSNLGRRYLRGIGGGGAAPQFLLKLFLEALLSSPGVENQFQAPSRLESRGSRSSQARPPCFPLLRDSGARPECLPQASLLCMLEPQVVCHTVWGITGALCSDDKVAAGLKSNCT